MGIVDSLFTEAEYTAVKKSIKEGRACRYDGISARVLKQLKAGDLGRMKNYREISLSCIAAKFVNK